MKYENWKKKKKKINKNKHTKKKSNCNKNKHVIFVFFSNLVHFSSTNHNWFLHWLVFVYVWQQQLRLHCVVFKLTLYVLWNLLAKRHALRHECVLYLAINKKEQKKNDVCLTQKYLRCCYWLYMKNDILLTMVTALWLRLSLFLRE